MRIRGAKTELEEAGLETDGMVESTAKLRQEILALSGVDIMENANEFKSTYKIMDELAAKWENLTDIQQASITELIAGKRQGNIVSSLMTNFDTARDALETSLNSSGSAMQEHEKWQQSLEAQINKLKASWQGLSQAFLSSDFLKSSLDAVIGLVDGITKLIDTVGTLPTLVGVFAGGLSLFKNKGLFTFDKDIQSIQMLGNTFTGFGNTYASISTKIGKYNSLNAKHQMQFCNSMQNSNTSFGKYISGLNGGKASMAGYAASLVGAKVKTVALQVATTALNAAITMGVSFLISAAVSAIQKWINAEEELAEKVDEVTSKFKEQHSELIKNKSSFESEANRYAKLSKGVDGLGRNVSLTADEYSEYQSIVNSIADQIPSLVAGYDSQGNAILNCKGSVEELTTAYENLIKAQNNEVLTQSGDIIKDFKNKVEDNDNQGFWKQAATNLGLGAVLDYDMTTDSARVLNKLLNAKSNGDDVDEIINAINSDAYLSGEIQTALENAGVEFGFLGQGFTDILKKTLENEPEKIKSIIDDFNAELATDIEQMATIAQATISQAFDISDSDYASMSDGLQNIAKQIVNSFDYDFYSALLNNDKYKGDVEQYINDMLDAFDQMSNINASQLEASFNLKTQFNNDEISYGEYVKGLEDTSKIIDGLALDEEIKSQIKLNLGLNEDGIVEEYESLNERLVEITTKDLKNSGHFSGGSDALKTAAEDVKKFLDELSADELSVVTDIIPELDAGATIKEIQAVIDREMAVQGLTFDLNLEVEATGIEALNTAMAESVSGAGLSSESIAALKGRYAELESEGYNLSAMFEETSNGIHLNRNSLRELEKAYAQQKQSDITEQLGKLEKEYQNVTRDIENCNDASERASLYVQRDAIIQQINDAATLATQYEGLTSAYNDWLAAEEAGQERDMYENMLEGFENIGDEISRGWLDDGTIEFLELLTGRTDLATLSAKELKNVYKGLDKNIKNTSHSIRDFFTVDEDGNSTSQGVYNFLDAIGQLEEEEFGGKDVVKRDKNGKIIEFDIELAGGEKAIADALGISEELVQIMLRAADDAGFVVNLDGAYTQLADLKTEAEKARDSLIKLKKDGLEELKNTDVNFNLDAEGQDLVDEQAKAAKLLDKFRNKDGTINTKLEGADEALEIAEYLTLKLDDLTEPKYMQIDTSTVEEDLREPIEKMQEFERLAKEKHLLTLTGDKKKLQETEEKMKSIAEYLDELDEETQVELGIDGLSSEEIAEKLEKGEIEIPAELNVDLQMSDDLKDMRLMMMNQLGLVSDDEVKLKIGYDIDDSAIDDLTPDEQKVVVDFIAKNEDEFDKLTDEEKEVVVDIVADDSALKSLEEHGVEIEAFCNIFGIEKVDDLKKKLDNLTDEQILVLAEVLGRVDVEKLKTTVAGLDDKTIEAIAKALGEGDVKGLKTTINGLDDKTVQAIAQALGYSDVSELNNAIDNLDPKTVQAIAQALGITDVDSLKAAIDRLSSKDVDAVANVDGKDDVNSLKNAIDNLKGKTVTVWASIKKKASSLWDKLTGGGSVDGTAHANGTAFAEGTVNRATVKKSGRAYKQGDWGTKDSGIALGGEEAPELLVRNGRWHLIGEKGAEFFGYKKGDIIFNASQTKEIFEKGKITHGNGRGKALVSGTAFSKGTGGGIEPEVKSKSVSSKKSSSSSSSSSSDEFEETLDWIEVAISRIERAIDNLDQKASNVYKSWSERNKALTSEISKVGDEIELQQSAYNRYMQEANSVGLSSSLAAKVRNGEIDIETIKDEALKEKIDDYKKYYEQALDCQDAIEELKETESELYAQRFENVQAQYDGILQGYEHTESMLNEYISQAEAQGHIISTKYYDALIENEKSNITELKKEQSALIAERDKAVADGKIVKGSEAWYEQCAAIDEVTQSIEEANTALIEYNNSIRDIEWQQFDLIQERISDITAESEFLIELMSNKDLFDDNGKFTEQGVATVGLHALNYNTAMYQADDYGKEIAELDKQIAKDPYDQELINRRRELVELQRESILEAENQKNAIKDLVEEGINLELDALQERIDLHNEELDSMKDLYDYQKNIEEQTKNIASLHKQLGAYEGFDDEETRAKVQELKVSLEEAEADLKETEYDKFISDQTVLLDTLYTEYETVLNSRLDNIDFLLEQVIDGINMAAGAEGTITSALGSEGAIAAALGSSTTTIGETLKTEVGNVGTKLSTAMSSIWTTDGTGKAVIDLYGKDFQSKHTTTNEALNSIKANVNAMVDDIDKDAQKKVAANKTSTSAKKNPTKDSTSNKKPATTTNKTTNKPKSSGDGKAKVGDKVKFVSGKYYYDSQGTKPLGSKYQGKEVYITSINTKSWATHPYHISTGNKLGKGDLGWLKLNQLSGYATGKKKIFNNEYAWTQENGQEYIIRPSDGAILTPIARGDSVLNATASGNIWNMANNPAEFIKDNLKLDTANIPSGANVQNSYTQHLDKVVFNLPNVKNYEELLSALRDDKNFDRLIKSMTVDQIAGKSSLAKGKSIR